MNLSIIYCSALGLRLILIVKWTWCSGWASGTILLMRHSKISPHPISKKWARSVFSSLGI